MDAIVARFVEIWAEATAHPIDTIWLLIGLGGNALFMMRFVVQWFFSEKSGRSIIPVAFWFFSIGGALVLLAYGIYKGELVIIFGQGLGLLVYFRNLWLIYGRRRTAGEAEELESARKLATQLGVTLAQSHRLDDNAAAVAQTLAELSRLTEAARARAERTQAA